MIFSLSFSAARAEDIGNPQRTSAPLARRGSAATRWRFQQELARANAAQRLVNGYTEVVELCGVVAMCQQAQSGGQWNGSAGNGPGDAFDGHLDLRNRQRAALNETSNLCSLHCVLRCSNEFTLCRQEALAGCRGKGVEVEAGAARDATPGLFGQNGRGENAGNCFEICHGGSFLPEGRSKRTNLPPGRDGPDGCEQGEVVYSVEMSRRKDDDAFAALLRQVAKPGEPESFKLEAADNLMESLFRGNLDTVIADLDVIAKIESGTSTR